MVWAEREGVRIWFEVEGAGPPVLLLHGGAATGQAWRITGYVEALRNDFQLILVDARGNGRSDRPSDYRTYRALSHAADVIAVLDGLKVDRAGAIGFSMGGATALALAALYPERTAAVVSIDGSPTIVGFADHRPPVTQEDWDLVATIEREGLAPFIAMLEAEGRPQYAELFRATDPAAFALQARAWADPEELDIRIEDIRCPLLYFYSDQVGATYPVVPQQARVIQIPGSDHVGVLEATDTVIPAARKHLHDALD